MQERSTGLRFILPHSAFGEEPVCRGAGAAPLSAFFIPQVVWQISLSHSISNAGRMNTTLRTLMMAPRAISIHMELMISISEYSATPKVAANSPIPDTRIDGMEVASAVVTAARQSAPERRSVLYRVVIRMA